MHVEFTTQNSNPPLHLPSVLYYAAGGMVFLRALIHLSGLAIFAQFYECDPLGAKEPASVVVVYVLSEITKIPGLAGIFVASIYAAVLR